MEVLKWNGANFVVGVEIRYKLVNSGLETDS
jgi:hypothetical protein